MPKKTTVDRVKVVREMWPNDDFNALLDSDDLATAAAAVREIMQSLATATCVGRSRENSLPYAGDGYDLIGGLASATLSEQELLTNLEAWANNLATDATLRHADHRGETAEVSRAHASTTAYELSESLRAAAQHLAEATAALRTAHTKISPLYQDED
ncbi:hypothetical protein [Nocardia camponoti]|uniref:Uncharacterized protein n=1 Tax=Nocardia camponoti TaxID=1616106 RepID=A0A917QUW8_9NOCA|nr:hypothetical protein [Nocardia camponoti]GGK69207.1 hypothetical protein GCM10011591_46670 [Nocardia camponoti]